MIKVLFVCHGNICRSPMAEFVLKDMVSRAGIAEHFYIESAATSSEELGNPVYPPARRMLASHGIDCAGKTARRISARDYDEFDLLIGMDDANMRNMARCFGGDPDGKLRTMLSFCGRAGESVADPWYTGNFEATWDDVFEGCTALLNLLYPAVTLDFSDCRERGELFEEMSRKMLWQPWYGHNLDALDDILTGMLHHGSVFTVIMPAGDSPCYACAEQICRIFEDCGKTITVE